MRGSSVPEQMRRGGLDIAGAVLCVAGFVVTSVTWWNIHTIENPAAQYPYIVSGGLTAIGLFVTGAAFLTAGLIARQRGSVDRQAAASLQRYRPRSAAGNGSGRLEATTELDMPDDVARRRAAVAQRHLN